ncbi:MAG: hypothetical protein J07HB67_02795 [halophilic archaeon J07HB67]|nr:MAG: hypothetical protein J07HB67_02795 [halophilic archaeon J07HB67]
MCGPSVTNVSNSPPSPSGWTPYASRRSIRSASVSWSNRRPSHDSSSPAAATWTIVISKPAASICSARSTGSSCHNGANRSIPSRSHIPSIREVWNADSTAPAVTPATGRSAASVASRASIGSSSRSP